MSRGIPDGTLRYQLPDSNIPEKAIALTFDDGPSGYTEELLDGLKECNAKASFFIIGCKAEQNPEIVKRAYEEGHLIGNHTYDHIRLPLHTLEECEVSIGKTFNIIENITGDRTMYLRAPYGDVSAYQLKQLDVVFVSWTFSTYDWKEKDADYIYEKLVRFDRGETAEGEFTLNGEAYSLKDATEYCNQTLEKLEQFIHPAEDLRLKTLFIKKQIISFYLPFNG